MLVWILNCLSHAIIQRFKAKLISAKAWDNFCLRKLCYIINLYICNIAHYLFRIERINTSRLFCLFFIAVCYLLGRFSISSCLKDTAEVKGSFHKGRGNFLHSFCQNICPRDEFPSLVSLMRTLKHWISSHFLFNDSSHQDK